MTATIYDNTPVGTVAPLISAINVFVDNPPSQYGRTRLNMNAAIADIDIVTADKEIEAGVSAYCDVVVPGVVRERAVPDRGVLNTGCVTQERLRSNGRVVVACCVEVERSRTGGRVVGPAVFKSASSPRTMFALVKQPSWHVAWACGESAKLASANSTTAR